MCACVCAAVRMHGYMRMLPVIMCSPTPRPDGCRTPTYLLANVQHRCHCSIHRTPTTHAHTHTLSQLTPHTINLYGLLRPTTVDNKAHYAVQQNGFTVQHQETLQESALPHLSPFPCLVSIKDRKTLNISPSDHKLPLWQL